MSEMIERVARAISGAPFPSKISIARARAAIEVMRESTYGMNLAGQSVVNLSDEPGRYSYLSRAETQDIWQTMIDEALK